MHKDELKKTEDKTEDKHRRNLTYEDWMVKKEEDELNKWRKARDEARRRRAEIEKEQKMKEQLKKTEEVEKQKKEEEMKMKEEELRKLQEDQKALLSNQTLVQSEETEDPLSEIQKSQKTSSSEEPKEGEQEEEASAVQEAQETSEKLEASEPEDIPEPEVIVKIESVVTVPGAPIPQDSVKGEDNLEVNIEGTSGVPEDEVEPKSETPVQNTDHNENSKIENSNENDVEKVDPKVEPKVESTTEPLIQKKVVSENIEDSKSSENNLREKSNFGQFIPKDDDNQREELPSRKVFNALCYSDSVGLSLPQGMFELLVFVSEINSDLDAFCVR